VVGHAGTFLRQENSEGELLKIKYYDPNENHFFERGGHKIDYQKLFDRYIIITVCYLHGRPVADKTEEVKIRNKMKRIMLGEDNSDYVKAIKIDNAKDTNERISASPVRR
jgi:hypothetical protein